MDRRRFLRTAVGAAAGVALVACDSSSTSTTEPPTSSDTDTPTSSSSPSTTTTTTTSPSSSPAPSTTVAPVPTDLDALARTLDGTIVRPGDGQYDTLRLLQCTRFDDQRPLAVIAVASIDDVSRAINYVRTVGTPFAVRSGGHSYGGWSTSSGLVIDVRALARIDVRPAAGMATIGAGAQMIDVYSTLAADDLAVAGGTCPTVGMAGLALGGGHGLVGRAFGLTCDALRAVEIVTADGVVHRCDAQNDTELFWACRGGGGGSFGVVTEFTVEAHPMPASVTTFLASYSWANAETALAAWMRWVPTLPDAMTTVARLETTPQLVIAGLHLGPVTEARDLIAPILPSARSQSATQHTFVDAMMLEAGCLHASVGACHSSDITVAGTLPRQTPFVASSHYFAEALSPAAITLARQAIDAHAKTVGSGGATIQFDSYGGAIARVEPTASAFVHRTAFCSAQYASFVASGRDDAHRAWLRSTRAALAPFSNGEAYQNYPDPELTDWQQAYYGTNLARLKQVKRAYDPGNLFTFPQAIPL